MRAEDQTGSSSKVKDDEKEFEKEMKEDLENYVKEHTYN